ncbi:Serine/threonine-protein kinase [Mycoemilia scoparia]|uniref:non-specific serine/threonine protein kinase n=1 Tax=Mycoemilia scoparia TaxID=417184 RepID=A0A9W8DMU7_9FUNG|nr:Serine/threonine-protein kinase [Mycoemilia scoparia]
MGQANSHGLVAYADFQPPLTAGLSSLSEEMGVTIQYDKSLRSTRFMKTIRCYHPKEGMIVVKIFTKPTYMRQRLKLEPYVKSVRSQHAAVQDLENILSYSSVIETDGAVFLIRQCTHHNLYDRISTRPFLSTMIEKKWIIFQILIALRESHMRGVCHGSLRTENILLTSWNWVYLSDYAPYKPTYLPADDPANFAYFFDTSARRICYVAPERFYDPDSTTAKWLSATEQQEQDITIGAGNNNAQYDLALKPGMDIFSAGCVIAEIIMDGTPMFNLSQILQYRGGDDSGVDMKLEKIEDSDIRDMVQCMISRDPSKRPDAEECLNRWQGLVFPDAFYSPLYTELLDIGSAFPYSPQHHNSVHSSSSHPQLHHQPGQSQIGGSLSKMDYAANHGSPATIISMSDMDGLGSDEIPGIILHTSDGRIARLYHHWPPLATQLSLCPDLRISETPTIITNNMATDYPKNDIAAILFTFVSSYLRNCAYSTSRRHGLELIQSLSFSLSDNIVMDRVVPLVISIATKDEAATTRVAAIYVLQNLLVNVDSIRSVDNRVFEDYLIPQLLRLASDPETVVRVALARTIAVFMETANRFAQLAFKNENDPDYADSISKGISSPLTADTQGNSSVINDKGANDEMVELLSLQYHFRECVGHLLADPSSEVKRALLLNFHRLCLYFHHWATIPSAALLINSNADATGEDVNSPQMTSISALKTSNSTTAENDTKDFLLSHIITYLNDRDSWLLRSYFFEAIVGVAVLVGRHALEEYIIPLMSQAIGDNEEFVIGSVLKAFSRLTKAGMMGNMVIREKVKELAPLLVHPNEWLRSNTINFIETASQKLPQIDQIVVISPVTRPCTRYDITSFEASVLTEALDTPISLSVYHEAVQLVMTLGRQLPETTFGYELKRLASTDVNIDSYPQLAQLTGTECHKLTLLKRFVEDSARNLQRQNMLIINNQDDGLGDDGIDNSSNSIQLKNIGASLHTVFLSPEDTNKHVPVDVRDVVGDRGGLAATTAASSSLGMKHSMGISHEGRVSFSSEGHLSTTSGYNTNQSGGLAPSSIIRTVGVGVGSAGFASQAVSSIGSQNRRNSNGESVSAIGDTMSESGTMKMLGGDRDLKSNTKRVVSQVSLSNAVATADSMSFSGRSNNNNSRTLKNKRPVAAAVIGTSATTTKTGGQTPGNDLIRGRGHSSDILSQLQKLSLDYAVSEPGTVSQTGTNEQQQQGDGDVETVSIDQSTAQFDTRAPITHSNKQQQKQDHQNQSQSINKPLLLSAEEALLAAGVDPFTLGDYGRRRSVARLLHKKATEAFPLAIANLGLSYPPNPNGHHHSGHYHNTPKRGPLGTSIMSGGSGSGMRHWEPEGILVAMLCDHQEAIRTMELSADHTILATGGDDGVIRIWDTHGFIKNVVHRPCAIHHQGGHVIHISFIAQTHSFVSCSDNGRIDLVRVDIESISEMVNAPIHHGQCTLFRKHVLRPREYGVQAEYMKTENGGVLVVATNQSRLVGYNLRTFDKVWEISISPNYGRVTCFGAEPKARWLVLGTAAGRLVLVDLRFHLVVKTYRHPLGSRIHQVSYYVAASDKERKGSSASGGKSNRDEASVLVAAANGDLSILGVESGEWKVTLATRGWDDIQKEMERYYYYCSNIMSEKSDDSDSTDSDMPPDVLETLYLFNKRRIDQDTDSFDDVGYGSPDQRNAVDNKNDDDDDDFEILPSNEKTPKTMMTKLSYPNAIRSIFHIPKSTFVVAGGNDCKIRFWNLQHLEKSYVIAGNGFTNRFTYESYKVGDTVYHCELSGQGEGSGGLNPGHHQQRPTTSSSMVGSHHGSGHATRHGRTLSSGSGGGGGYKRLSLLSAVLSPSRSGRSSNPITTARPESGSNSGRNPISAMSSNFGSDVDSDDYNSNNSGNSRRSSLELRPQSSSAFNTSANMGTRTHRNRILPPALDQRIGSHMDSVTSIQITRVPSPMLIVGSRDGSVRIYI